MLTIRSREKRLHSSVDKFELKQNKKVKKSIANGKIVKSFFGLLYILTFRV